MVVLTALALNACVQTPPTQPSVAEALKNPAERNFVDGLRAYDEARYLDAERLLQDALKSRLSNPKDQAAAHKTLAFIYCTSNRPDACEQAFRAARQSDKEFALSKAEAGHPLWGPVYLKSRR